VASCARADPAAISIADASKTTRNRRAARLRALGSCNLILHTRPITDPLATLFFPDRTPAVLMPGGDVLKFF
jgi:hypothetical protein